MRRVFLGVAAVLLLSTSLNTRAAVAVTDGVQVRVLSGRADLVSGNDALIEIAVPTGTDLSAVKVDVDGRDVSNVFRPVGATLRGFVRGFPIGSSNLTAKLDDGTGAGARLRITNAPQGGPVFSGPLIQPWRCNNGSTKPDCSAPPTIAFVYRPTSGGSMKAYDPSNPPSDVSNTTTDDGKTVPFVVRVETGYSLRDQYRIAALWTPPPGKPGALPDPTADNPGFAHKLVLTHGASCDTSYASADAPGVMLEDALAQGFAVASHALDNAGHNCNLVTQAESLIMTKEMVIERFGPLRYTIGSGCSGGSLVQQQVANAYPGVYQGITPQCSFTDAWSSAQQYVDYVGMREYLENPATLPQHKILPVQWPSIFGHLNPANAIVFTTAIANSGKPTRSCPGVPDDSVYNAQSNPRGVRCSLQDYMRNVFGLVESGPDKGKALRPIANVGVQYGLSGLLSYLDPTIADPTRPALMPDQFIALNEAAGGYDLDFNRTVARGTATALAQERAYRTGVVNTGAHMDQVAIIDLGGPEPGAFHDVYRKFSMRDRLIREHGTSANQVFWQGQTPLLGDISFANAAINKMDEWLAAVEADTRNVPLPRKIIDAKAKAGVVERCVAVNGIDAPLDLCHTTVGATLFSSPRIEAGGGDEALVNGVGPAKVGFADDRLDCEQMPIDKFVYAGRSFAQVFTPAQQARMRAVFPTGVCDYSKPGKGFQAAITWLRYQDANGRVVYGGAPMGDPPVSQPVKAAFARVLAVTGGETVAPMLSALLLALALALRRRFATK